jgi:rhodanese-related sulfurtransferase
MIKNLTPKELASIKDQGDIQIVDVREYFEVNLCRIDGAIHIPLRQLVSSVSLPLEKEKKIVCYCHHGVRSLQSAMYLISKGFKRVYNLSGGIHHWALEVDPSMATY